MKKKEEICNEIYLKFKNNHLKSFEQPIIHTFLKNKKNLKIVQQAIFHPTKENRQQVDKEFRVFYKKIRILTYISKLIHYNSIKFDKDINEYYKHELLILDKPIQNEDNNITYKDILLSPSTEITEKIFQKDISDHIENIDLYHAIKKLTYKQQNILTYIYVHKLKNKEIAKITNSSPQNISKLHKNSLQKLKKYLQKEV